MILPFKQVRTVLISIQFIMNHQINFLIYISKYPQFYASLKILNIFFFIVQAFINSPCHKKPYKVPWDYPYMYIANHAYCLGLLCQCHIWIISYLSGWGGGEKSWQQIVFWFNHWLYLSTRSGKVRYTCRLNNWFFVFVLAMVYISPAVVSSQNKIFVELYYCTVTIKVKYAL